MVRVSVWHKQAGYLEQLTESYCVCLTYGNVYHLCLTTILGMLWGHRRWLYENTLSPEWTKKRRISWEIQLYFWRTFHWQRNSNWVQIFSSKKVFWSYMPKAIRVMKTFEFHKALLKWYVIITIARTVEQGIITESWSRKMQNIQLHLNFRQTMISFTISMPCILHGTYLTLQIIHCLLDIQI